MRPCKRVSKCHNLRWLAGHRAGTAVGAATRASAARAGHRAHDTGVVAGER